MYIINLVVGGTNFYFPDGFGKPWNSGDPNVTMLFWLAKDQWYPTWIQPIAIDSVKMWSTKRGLIDVKEAVFLVPSSIVNTSNNG